MITMSIKGGKQVHDLLQMLPVQVETKILRNALVEGAKVLRDEARLQVGDTTKTGELRKAIKTSRDTRQGRIIAKVKLKGKHAYLGYFFEFGVLPHFIARTGRLEGRVAVGMAKANEYKGVTARRLKRKGREAIELRPMKIGDDFVSGIISHPGFTPKPFFRPALDTKATEAVNAVGAYLTKYLQFGNISAPVVAVDEEE